jgi:hypothetical protein
MGKMAEKKWQEDKRVFAVLLQNTHAKESAVVFLENTRAPTEST